jgi:hypothetical protein
MNLLKETDKRVKILAAEPGTGAAAENQ